MIFCERLSHERNANEQTFLFLLMCTKLGSLGGGELAMGRNW